MNRDEFANTVRQIARNHLHTQGNSEPTIKQLNEQVNWICARREAEEISAGYDTKDMTQMMLNGLRPFSLDEFITEAEENDAFEDILDFLRTL
jgi:hypothetical protein